MARKKPRMTSDAVKILHRRYFEGQPERSAELEAARASAAIARTAYELRTKARLSQQELARRIGVAKAVRNCDLGAKKAGTFGQERSKAYTVEQGRRKTCAFLSERRLLKTA